MNLSDWLDAGEVEPRLIEASMQGHAASAAAQLFAKSAAALNSAGVGSPTRVVACWVPGRIEAIGKHTDYCGGSSVLAAADRGFAMIAARRDDKVLDAIDAIRMQSVQFRCDLTDGTSQERWSNYVHTVVRRIAKNFPHRSCGATLAFASNLPASAGMSSSSALIVGTFLVMAEIGWIFDDELFKSCLNRHEKLAGYLGSVENGSSYGLLAGDAGVGTFGGSEDHTAILCGRPDRLVQYRYSPIKFEREIELRHDFVFAVASSGVVAEKTGGACDKYNRLSLLVKAIVDQWRKHTGRRELTLAAILASSDDAAARLEQILQKARHATFTNRQLLERLEHFKIESQLVASVPPVLDQATVGRFGEIVQQSQRAAESLLGNQTLETSYLVEAARRLGAHAASAFGAGFGGSVWALIDQKDTEFNLRWKEGYAKEFPNRLDGAAFFTCRLGPPAQVWSETADAKHP